MNKIQLGELLDAFAEFYWSVPIKFVCKQIASWHPELQEDYILKVAKGLQNHGGHRWIVSKDGLTETELTAEHLYAVDEEYFWNFVDSRYGNAYFPAPEEQLMRLKEYPCLERTEEVSALEDFAHRVMGLDDEWTRQLLHDCIMQQADALCDGESWVRSVMQSERYGEITFTSLKQLAEFRQLGNALYQKQPNPVLKGWRPCDLEDTPPLPDDMPDEDDLKEYLESVNKIRDMRGTLAQMRDDEDETDEDNWQWIPPKPTVGRNDPCPCGSGKKYKKCCGAAKN